MKLNIDSKSEATEKNSDKTDKEDDLMNEAPLPTCQGEKTKVDYRGRSDKGSQDDSSVSCFSIIHQLTSDETGKIHKAAPQNIKTQLHTFSCRIFVNRFCFVGGGDQSILSLVLRFHSHLFLTSLNLKCFSFWQ
jgi:hypothetical protein